MSCKNHHYNVLALQEPLEKGMICRGLFEFSSFLPLDLKINQNPLIGFRVYISERYIRLRDLNHIHRKNNGG